MKKKLIAVLLLLVALAAKPQASLLEHPLPVLTDNYHYERINCVTDSQHNRLYLVMLSKNTVHAVKISLPGFTVEKEITGTIADDDELEEYYGSIIGNDSLTLLYSSRRRRVNVFRFIFETGFFLNIPVATENKKEKILNAFVWQNKMCLLKLIDPKNDAERHLQINREGNDGVFIVSDFRFRRNKQEEQREIDYISLRSNPLLKNDNYKLITIPSLRTRYPNILNYDRSYIKQYCVKDKLIITEEYDNSTAVFEMDMMKNESKMHYFRKDGILPGAEWVDCSNSFVLEDKLYQVKAGKGKLALNLYNISDGTLLKRYTFSDQSNDFGYNDALINENHEGAFPFSGKDRVVEGMKSFTNGLKGNFMAIAAERKSDAVKLTAGALKVEWVPTDHGSTKYVSSNALYFNTWLDAATLNMIPPDTVAVNAYEKIDAMFAKIDEKINKYDFFKINAQDYFCYYNQRKNKVCVVKAG